MITPVQLKGIGFWELVIDELGIDPYRSFSDMDRHRIIRRLVGKEVSDVIHATQAQLEEHRIQSPRDIWNANENIITYSKEGEQLNRELKDFLYNNLYRHWRVMRMHLKAHRFIIELFEAYVHSPFILPTDVQKQANQKSLYRTVCDYVAGMTDRFATQEHNRLFNPLAHV
jgi:dGTPase